MAHITPTVDDAEPAGEPDVRHPDVHVQLTGEDGNAFLIIGWVTGALRRAGYGSETEEYASEAMSGDYDHVLATTMRWVSTS